MSAISTFQSLPLHIAKVIAGYYINTIMSDDSRYLGKDWRPVSAWSKLYNVSYSWRLLALQFFFEELTIRIMVAGGTGRLDFTNLPANASSRSMRPNYVKRVNVDFPTTRKQPYDTPPKDLSAAWPEDLVLPSARSLNIALSVLHYQQFVENDATNNERFYWITQRIQNSMPKLSKVSIEDGRCGILPGRGESEHLWKADEFLSAVLSKATAFNICTSTINLTRNNSLVHNNTELTSINCGLDNKNNALTYIIRTSAPTLESLTFDDGTLDNVRGLMFDDNENPIVYPRLGKLTFYGDWGTNLDKCLRVDKSVAPFPALRYLKWSAKYVFEDNTLFRGNSDTLEYADIVLDDYLLDLLERHNVFTGGKYSKLSRISLRDHGYYSDNWTLSIDSFMRLTIAMFTPSIRYLSLKCKLPTFLITHCVETIPDSKCIQTLDLTGTKWSLHNVFGLIMQLPNMTRLCLADPGLVFDEPRPIKDNDSANILRKEFYPLSIRFKHLGIDSEYPEDVGAVVAATLALAITCPSFVSTLVTSDSSNQYRLEFDKALKSGLYDEHICKSHFYFQHIL